MSLGGALRGVPAEGVGGNEERMRRIVAEGEISPSCGLPIGNLTSQFLANLYLSPLDHFVLEQLKPCGYVRYMDDMVIFADSMAALKVIFIEAESFCKKQLHLTLKEASFGKWSDGVPFLGWRIAKDGVFLLAKTKRRMKKKLLQIQTAADEIVKFKQLLDSGIISQEEFDKKKKELLGL